MIEHTELLPPVWADDGALISAPAKQTYKLIAVDIDGNVIVID